MDKQFKMSAYTFFIERYGTHITKFRKNDARNVEFMQRMIVEKDKLRGLVSEEIWQHFESYIELMSLHSDIYSVTKTFSIR